MKVKLTGDYASGEYDTKTMKLVCLPGRGKILSRNEIDADLCIEDDFNAYVCIEYGSNAYVCIAQIHMGNVESANALCKEIVRRFNDFPEELKQ